MNHPPAIVECPRDAMQGMHDFIPTQQKAAYINALLRVGFNTIDFGSFVSPKAVPQMADTAELIGKLDLSASASKLLAIIANLRGAEDACRFDEITYLGYPFSISEVFQQRNTKKSISESVELVKEIHNLCLKHEKVLVVYISMGFGNPYDEPWSPEIAAQWVDKLASMGISIISLADTIGCATPESISNLFSSLIPKYEDVTFGAHFHSHPATRGEKLEAAWQSGCRRFDVAMKGFGGCPFAKDELVGNISTESLIQFLENKGALPALDQDALAESQRLAAGIFG